MLKLLLAGAGVACGGARAAREGRLKPPEGASRAVLMRKYTHLQQAVVVTCLVIYRVMLCCGHSIIIIKRVFEMETGMMRWVRV